MWNHLKEVQQSLLENQLDGWLLYDYRRSNDIACRFLEIPSDQLLTRRFFYWIPTKGEPIKIVSAVEPHTLDHLPGKPFIYHSWQELENILALFLKRGLRIALEYSPMNAVPSISKIDAGTMDLIRKYQVEVVSSGDMVQKYTSVLTQEQFNSHFIAANFLDTTANKTWSYISECFRNAKVITEYDVQNFMIQEMEKHGFVSDSPPICAVNEHSADPHYSPKEQGSKKIQKGDFVLIDLWCRKNQPQAIYADISRVGIVNKTPNSKQNEIFHLVRKAQKAATEFVINSFQLGKQIYGWQVDDAARKVIIEGGYGKYFIHRTGHNIGIQDHGTGTHMDNLETHDNRLLLPNTCFSIEPGIYLPSEFGVRLEYDVCVLPSLEIKVTGGIQDNIYLIN